MCLLPAAAESLVELHDAQQFVQPDLRERQLGLKQIAIGIQSVQQRVHSAAIPDIGQPRPILQRARPAVSCCTRLSRIL